MYNLSESRKSRIRKGIRGCKLVNHFLDIDHGLDFSFQPEISN